MVIEAFGAEDRAYKGIPQSHAEWQGDHIRSSHAQYKAGLRRQIPTELVCKVDYV